jgi:hypothetical protein
VSARILYITEHKELLLRAAYGEGGDDAERTSHTGADHKLTSEHWLWKRR